MQPRRRTVADTLTLLLAEGFGVGRFPFAPGTLATLAAFAWVYLLLLPQNLLIYLGGIVGGFFASVWAGTRAEEILGKKDPGQIVIDEIAAIPLAFLPAVISTAEGNLVAGFPEFLRGKSVILPLMTFVLFRIFDIAKPFGIRRTQDFRGGWGLTIDDFLAAAAAALLLTAYLLILK